MFWIAEASKNKLKHSVVLTFQAVHINCSNDLFCKFSAFTLEFQKFFSIIKTFFSHSRLKQFPKQNTITALTAGNIEQCENEIGLLLACICAFRKKSDLNFSRGNFFSRSMYLHMYCQAINSELRKRFSVFFLKISIIL